MHGPMEMSSTTAQPTVIDEKGHGESHEEHVNKDLQIVFYTFLFLIVGAVSRQVVQMFSMSLPFHFLLVLAGMFIGFLSKVFDSASLRDPILLDDNNASILVGLFLPLFLFDAAYNMSADDFQNMSLHVVLVVIPTFVVTIVTMAFVGTRFFPYEYLDATHYIMLMCATMMPSPQITKSFTQAIGSSAMVRNLLEAEALFGNCLGFAVFDFCFQLSASDANRHNTHVDIVSHLFHIFISALIGFICGKLVISWISWIFKDHVNQITIVVASIYVTYSLCNICNASGFFAIVVFGILMLSKRASMSSFSSQSLNSFNRIAIFTFTSITVIVGGILIWLKVVTSTGLEDIVVSLIIFAIVFAIRFIILLILHPVYRRYYLKIRTKIVVLAVCNLRGSYSLALALIMRNINPGGEKMFVLVTLQVLLSFVINTPISSMVIMRLGKTAVSEKVIMIERVARSMNNLRTSLIQSLKGSVFTADADWDVVMKQTQLKHEFLKLYKNRSRLLEAAKAIKNQSKDKGIDISQIKEEAIRQVINAQRMNIGYQLEEGVLSREGVTGLRHITSVALDNKHLVDPTSVIKKKQANNFLRMTETNLESLNQEKGLHRYLKLVLYAFFLLDYVLTLTDFVQITLFSSHRSWGGLITMYNVVFILLFSLYFLSRRVTQCSVWPTSIWDYQDLVILAVTAIDSAVNTFRLFRHTHSVATLPVEAALVASRFFRVTKIFEISPLFQIRLLNIVQSLMAHSTFVGIDMCRGFALATLESQKRVSIMIMEKTIGKNLKTVCQQSRLAMAQHLGLMQMDNPGVMAAIKTRNASRLILNGLDNITNSMKEIALLEDIDLMLIKREIEVRIILTLNSPFSIRAKTYRSIIRQLPWLEDRLITKFIESGSIESYNADSLILVPENKPDGVYVILQGMVRVMTTTDQARSTGRFSDCRIEESELMGEFLTPSHVLGMLTFLTGESLNNTCRSVTYVEVFHVGRESLASLMGAAPDSNKPMSPMEEKMWMTVAVSRAVRIMHSDVPNPEYSRSQLMYRMANAYIRDGNMTSMISVLSEHIDVVILVHGSARNYYTKAEYTGPCVIPLSAQKLISMPEKGHRVVYLMVPDMPGGVKGTSLMGQLAIETKPQDTDSLIYSDSHTSDASERSQENIMSVFGRMRYSENGYTSEKMPSVLSTSVI